MSVAPKYPSRNLVHPWETSKAPWIRIHLDFTRRFLDKIFLVLCDSYSSWIEVNSMPNINLNPQLVVSDIHS